jgi:beta-lactamase regulating signal transducer with metallopeptidase domain
MMSQVLNHLWQSTLLALALALLVLAFRKAPAGVRHGLWFAASAQFLIPFAALAALGRLLAPAIRLPQPSAPEAAFIAQAAQPFSQPALSPDPLAAFPFAHGPELQATLGQAPAAPLVAHADIAAASIPAPPQLDVGLLLLGVWVLGSAVMLVVWARRWARLRKVVRSARRLDWPGPMPVLAAPSLVEPGLVGLWRPVLLVPETLPGALSRPEIDALIAHEACHLRRRDNLTAALHMLVEALFWFHPLTWWIGARLIEERERACDEAVVRAGHDRAAYARSLVEICRLFLQSPLDCVAGASGSNLKTRVEAIMSAPPTSPLSRSGKALLVAAGVCAVATPVMAGLLTTPEGQTAVASAAVAVSRAVPVRIAAVERLAAQPETAADQSPAAKPVVLALNAPLLDPGRSIARLDAAAGPLTQDVAAPRVEQAPAQAPPDREEAVRNWVLALQIHQPALAKMSPAVEQAARGYWVMTEQMFRSFGELKAVTLVTTTPDGNEGYQVDFAHARIQVIVGPLTADGELSRLAWGPLWTQAGGRPSPKTPLAPDGMPAPLYCWCALVPAAVAPAPAVSSTEPARLSLTPIASKTEAAAHPDVSAFIQSYGEAFWNTDNRICVKVDGLTPDKDASFKARVEADARAVGVSIGRSECGLRNQIEIRFAADSERALTDVLNYYHHPVWPFPLDRPQGADRPIKAFYGMVYDFAGGAGGRGLGAHPNARQKLNLAIVVVDPARTANMSPDAVADYVAMLALSQPRALDKCNVLPSITDLLVSGCSGRAAQGGLTAADTAYLTALYTGSSGIRATRSPEELVNGMARRLAGGGAIQPAVARAAAPRLQLTPIAYTTPAADQSDRTSAFVRSYAFEAPTGPRGVARWRGAVRLQVSGLSAEQNAAVEARIRAVASAVGAPGTGLSPPNSYSWGTEVAILFAADPQRVLDDIVAHKPYLLGDQGGVKSITRPVQAWYQVDDQYDKRFGSILVIVDLRRTHGVELSRLADYVAMAALSEPRTVDRCQPLPSVMDLFAGSCAGRSAPNGLTPADDAYLTGLYGGASVYDTVHPDEIAARMAKILASPSDATLRKTSDIMIGNSNIRRSAKEMGAVDR